MASGTELEALTRISQAGGKIDVRTLARKMGRNTSYMSVICRSLGKADYIDLSASGMCVITPKGEEELAKKKLVVGSK